MVETILKIDGMMCGMCEAHVNDVIRRDFTIKKVTSSHTKGTCTILSEEALDEEKLHTAIEATGYRVLEVSAHPYEKRGIFSFIKK
ncbi:MAG: cation transporter [Lachnospiraceae bacterium]|nr:cation transporter [Lachnospiraceae bacterium]